MSDYEVEALRNLAREQQDKIEALELLLKRSVNVFLNVQLNRLDPLGWWPHDGDKDLELHAQVLADVVDDPDFDLRAASDILGCKKEKIENVF